MCVCVCVCVGGANQEGEMHISKLRKNFRNEKTTIHPCASTRAQSQVSRNIQSGPGSKSRSRQMTYRAIPDQETMQVKNQIKYSRKTGKWECAKCGKREDPQEKRNLIQHVLRTHNNKESNTKQECKLTQKEHKINKIRIRTLEMTPTHTLENTEQGPETQTPPKHKQTLLTETQEEYNEKYWERIGMAKNEQTQQWKCLMPQCDHGEKKTKAITQRLAKNTPTTNTKIDKQRTPPLL